MGKIESVDSYLEISTVLNFDRTAFPEDEEYDERFVYFVDLVFIFHDDSDIHRFSLCWHSFRYDDIMKRHVSRWMAHAVKHNVQEMTIYNTDRHLGYEIPHQLLNCKSLTKLDMQMYRVLEYVDTTLPKSMCLPRLKFLWLGGFSIANVELSKRLFSSCPALETLVIANSDIQTDDQRNLIVDSLSLKKFNYFNHYVHLLPHNNTMPTTIKLRAPNIGAVYMVEKMRLSAGFLESNLAVIGDDWEAGLSSPGMLSHLEYVSIEKVEGCDAELKLLSFLLKMQRF
ncbi:hypothetical protein C5167_050969 [Papaver somniferum]|uniref:F-box/LRR-repeat protein 15/At3g58940/PEG3-like LRR domain-containing protein n=1 Tax=Papaver somniferum TaxID=3469 RepID=A0A4Y7KU59_PAPSO|nr:hypothetical protein C5167_050969 [Papaver somniferum]